MSVSLFSYRVFMREIYMNTVKKNYQDTVFTRLFGAKNKRYLFELYQTLHPEDTTTSINDLELLTIENALTNDIYNDLKAPFCQP